MRKLFIVTIILCGMMFACTDNLDYVEVSNQITRAYVDEDTPSLTNPTLINDWENTDTIYLNRTASDGSLLSVIAPWANGTASTLSADFRTDILKENGWRMLFHTFSKGNLDDGQNYLCFYNKLTGYIKIFYHYENESNSTGTMWFLTTGNQPKSRLLNETEYLSLGNDSLPLTNLMIASNMGLGPLNGLTPGWNGFEFQVPYADDYDANTSFTISAYNKTITGIELAGDVNLETVGTIVTKSNESTTPALTTAIANLAGNKVHDYISGLAENSDSNNVTLGSKIIDLLNSVESDDIKSLIADGLNLIFGKTSSSTTYNSDVKLSTTGTITISGTAISETTSGVKPISVNYFETMNSTDVADEEHFLGVWRLKKNPTIKQGRIMLFNSPDIIQGSATSSFVTLRGTVQFPPMKVENVEVEINPDLEPYVTNVATTTSILYCDSLQGSAYKSGVREARYLENGTRLLYSDEFNHFREITPGEDRMTLTINYQKSNSSDPLPNTYFYDWGDPTDGRVLLVVNVEITYNYQGKEIVVNQSRTYAPTYIVDESYGTRPHHVHYPPYSVIVNYNQPYLD